MSRNNNHPRKPPAESESFDLRAGQEKLELGRNPRVAPLPVNEANTRYKKAQARKFAGDARKKEEAQGRDSENTITALPTDELSIADKPPDSATSANNDIVQTINPAKSRPTASGNESTDPINPTNLTESHSHRLSHKRTSPLTQDREEKPQHNRSTDLSHSADETTYSPRLIHSDPDDNTPTFVDGEPDGFSESAVSSNVGGVGKVGREMATGQKPQTAKGFAPKRDEQPRKSSPRKNTSSSKSKPKPKSRLRFDGDNQVGRGHNGKRSHSKVSSVAQPLKEGTSATIGSVGKFTHDKISQHEHENVGVEAAHKGELMVEKGLQRAYQHRKSVSHRRAIRASRRDIRDVRSEHRASASKFRLDSNKTDSEKVSHSRTTQGNGSRSGKSSQSKALRGIATRRTPLSRSSSPQQKTTSASRKVQKLHIKRRYAKAAREARRTGKFVAFGVSKVKLLLTKVAAKTVALVANPKVLLALAIAGLIIIMILGLISACSSVGSSFAAMSYLAEEEDIDNAALLFSELEVDLKLLILGIEDEWPEIDEFRFNHWGVEGIGLISGLDVADLISAIYHDPFMLMAFLTAVYQDFTFADVEIIIQTIFDERYALEVVEEVEIRIGEGIDPDTGESYEYEYEWFVLNVTLITRPLLSVINGHMDSEQREHYALLMQSRGLRQIVGSPFASDWHPFISSNYGWRIHPITGDKDLHLGIDIALPTGTPIMAAHGGVVTFAGELGGYGLVVMISDENGNETRYAHCDTLLVSEGQVLSAGDVIATVGSTGNSTGPHLHFEVISNGRHVSPLFFAMAGGFW
jgi:hypothetical protein